ncbi:MAG: tRNA-intron lyase [Candidatus Micrarchaeota archaeon]|nr:tRNA-intron lyase [Candidatus Micrarchaeota archaeon]
MLELALHDRGRITPADDSTTDVLRRGFYGRRSGKSLELSVEEALYLLDMRNAACERDGKPVGFNELASEFADAPKFMARYFTYKDWRDRGLVAIAATAHARARLAQPKAYPASSFRLPKTKLHGVLFSNDLVSVIEEPEAGRQLYEKFWIGQYGSYKASDRGSLSKLDAFESMLLMDNGVLTLDNSTRGALMAQATEMRDDFPSLYEVYKDWREKGYVVKTGFKFGTHFRVYFPGAKPMEAGGDQTHSKHVIQVFPKSSKMLISEWARAIRVAHSVRKTLILAVPGKTSAVREGVDFVLYHRHGGEADAPGRNPPRFAMLSLSEEEYIGGQEFAKAINEAKRLGLDLLLAIADRETAVTYYRVRQIKLSGSANDYFEIDWMQP